MSASDHSRPAPEAAAGREAAVRGVRAALTSPRPATLQRAVVPGVTVAAVAAAACVPVVFPLLPLAAAGPVTVAAVQASLGLISGVGVNVVSEAVVRTWEKLRGSGTADEESLRDALTLELAGRLERDGAAGQAVRREVASLLRGVDAVQIAIEAGATPVSAAGATAVVAALRRMATEFTEFRWLGDDVDRRINEIAEGVARSEALSREIADSQQQALVELALLRRETRRRDGRSDHVRSGPRSPDPPPGPDGVAAPDEPDERHDEPPEPDEEPPPSPYCPYAGLAAFQPADFERFFGRERLTGLLVARLNERAGRPGPLLVLGASGSGKSSLLKAGLIPALGLGELPIPGSADWPRELMTPGRHPLLELATRIGTPARLPAGSLAADLRADPARVRPAIRQALLAVERRTDAAAGPDRPPVEAGRQPPPLRLVLVVDQFEEVFTQCDDEAERAAFVAALVAASGSGPDQAGDAPALVVIGLRADFYVRCAEYAELARGLAEAQVLVGPLDEAGLRAAIEQPARGAGLRLQAGLVEVLLADLGMRTAGGYPAGRLPLLSYALERTWGLREGRELTIEGYRRTGGIDGAVARAADGVYRGLRTEDHAIARDLLLRLTAPDRAGEPATRRRAALSELTGRPDSESAQGAARVLAALVEARLVIVDTSPVDGTTTVEISHETLLHAWPTLREWLADDVAGQRLRSDLTRAAAAWREHADDAADLYRGVRLLEAERWAAASRGRDLTGDEAAFLAAGRQAEQRRSRRARGTVVALSLLLVLSLVTTVIAVIQRDDARRLRGSAERRAAGLLSVDLAGRAAATRADSSTDALLLALAAYRTAPSPEARTALVAAADVPFVTRLADHGDGPAGVALLAGGGLLAHTGVDGVLRIDDVREAGRPRPVATLPVGPARNLAAARDAPRLAVALTDAVLVIDVHDPARPSVLRRLPHRGARTTALALNRDGTDLALGTAAGELLSWRLPAGAPAVGPRTATVTDATVAEVAFDPETSVLGVAAVKAGTSLWTVGGDARAERRWQLRDARTDDDGDTDAFSVAFSPVSDLVVEVVRGVLRVWRVTGDRKPVNLGGDLSLPASRIVYRVGLARDGSRLALTTSQGIEYATLDNTPERFDHPVTLTGAAATLDEPETAVVGPPVYDVTNGFFTTSTNGVVRRWRPPVARLTGRLLSGGMDSVSPDGRIATLDTEQKVRLWEVGDTYATRQVGRFAVGSDPFTGGFLDDRLLATIRHRKVTLHDVHDGSGKILATVNGPSNPAGGLDAPSVSISGHLMTMLVNNRLQLVDIADARHPRVEATLPWTDVLAGGILPGRDIALAVRESAVGQLVDVRDPARPALGATIDEPGAASVDVEGQILVSQDAGQNPRLRVWRLKDARHLFLTATVPLDARAQTSHTLDFLLSAEAHLLVIAEGQRLRTVDISGKEPKPLGSVRLPSPVGHLHLSPDSRHVAVVPGNDADDLAVVDISDPAAPTLAYSVAGIERLVPAVAPEFLPAGRAALAVSSGATQTRIVPVDLDALARVVCPMRPDPVPAPRWRQLTGAGGIDQPCLG
jgi:hypothetical protein